MEDFATRHAVVRVLASNRSFRFQSWLVWFTVYIAGVVGGSTDLQRGVDEATRNNLDDNLYMLRTFLR